jgi:hypothetical protein
MSSYAIFNKSLSNISLSMPTTISAAAGARVLTVNSTAANNSLVVTNTGAVGVGTSAPAQALHVVGSAYVDTYVGVGTSTPTKSLHVVGDALVTSTLTTSNLNVLGTTTTINSYETNSSNVVINNVTGLGPALRVAQTGSGANYPVADFYDNDVSTTVPALRIADGGNVGVGTATPSAPLHVEGNVYVNGNISAGNLGMFRNKIINGNFDVWQRGTSFSVTTTATYTTDRWVVQFDGSGATRTISQQAFTPGQTSVPYEPTYFLRFAQSVAGSGGANNVLAQKVESVRTLAGQTATLSFYAKADANRSVQLNLTQVFGSGGSPSSSVYSTYSTAALTSSWAKYVFTWTLPSIAGKTLGTNNDDSLTVQFFLPINATFTIDVAQVQLEAGSAATPFEVRPYAAELALCQRYYEVIIGDTQGRSIMDTVYFGTEYWARWDFKQFKRANPSVTNIVPAVWGGTAPGIYVSTSHAHFYSNGTVFYLSGSSGVPVIYANAEL